MKTYDKMVTSSFETLKLGESVVDQLKIDVYSTQA